MRIGLQAEEICWVLLGGNLVRLVERALLGDPNEQHRIEALGFLRTRRNA